MMLVVTNMPQRCSAGWCVSLASLTQPVFILQHIARSRITFPFVLDEMKVIDGFNSIP